MPISSSRILIVDDDVAVTNYLMVFLMQNEIFEPTVINDSRQVPEVLEQESFDAILMDMDMPNLSGMDLLKIIHERKIESPVIVLSGVNDVDLAVRALKLGAFDYLSKPVEDEYLLEVINKAIEHHTLHDSISQLPKRLKREDLAFEEAFRQVPTQNPVMIRLFHQMEKMAAGDLCVFILGERGTGKQTLAKAIHNASPLRSGPFIALNAAAHDSERFAAEFFGQASDWQGETEQAGFLDQAEGGTLYISNIECLSNPVQVRLDRLIRSKEFYREGTTQIRTLEVRLIASSTKDLTSETYRESFSPDLLYHLWINSIQLPPLRERADDIPLLAEHFLTREIKRTGSRKIGIDPEYSAFLQTYEFPGNQDELRDIIASSVSRESGETLGIDSLSHYIRDKIRKGMRSSGGFRLRRLSEVIAEHVKWTVDYLNGDLESAAHELGIPLPELHDHLRG